jgi:hypothetical protein
VYKILRAMLTVQQKLKQSKWDCPICNKTALQGTFTKQNVPSRLRNRVRFDIFTNGPVPFVNNPDIKWAMQRGQMVKIAGGPHTASHSIHLNLHRVVPSLSPLSCLSSIIIMTTQKITALIVNQMTRTPYSKAGDEPIT